MSKDGSSRIPIDKIVQLFSARASSGMQTFHPPSLPAGAPTRTPDPCKERAPFACGAQNDDVRAAAYAALYKAVREYLNALAPDDNFFGLNERSLYHACIIAKNSQCVWHADKKNLGGAVLTTLGNFTGGELLLADD